MFCFNNFSGKKLLFWNGRSLAQKALQENMQSHIFFHQKKLKKKKLKKAMS